jgi:hypothetical protein
MRNCFALAALIVALAGAAVPALATTYPTTATFIVPTAVSNYPVPPDGNGGLSVYCSVMAQNGGALLGNGHTDIPVVVSSGAQNFSGNVKVTVTLTKVAQSGDKYQCDFGSNNGSPTKGLKFATSVLASNGTLP